MRKLVLAALALHRLRLAQVSIATHLGLPRAMLTPFDWLRYEDQVRIRRL